jgi:fructose-bisphosphate aldolase, class II
MPLLSMQELFGHSSRAQTPVVAFNVITLEHAEAVMWAAETTGIPAIAQLSENAIVYHDGPDALAAAMVSLARTSPGNVVLHLDHITQPDLARRTRDLGFSSVMWDSSTLPYEENVQATKDIVGFAHDQGIWVESEIGAIGGKGGAHTPGVRTDPAEAAAFARATGIDALAVAVGSSHAMTEQTAKLDTGLIRAISDAVDVPLVLHGSTGVPEDALLEATSAGMWKINIGTALNISATNAVRSTLESDQKVTDPRKYWGSARDAMRHTVAHYLSTLSKRLD